MTTAAINRKDIMARAWELTKEHMRRNSYTVWVFARNLRQAWAEAKTRAQGSKPVCDLTATERTLAAAMADPDSTARAEAELADRAAQEAADLAEKRELIESAKGRFCSVTFIKADGSERVMKVQPATLKFNVKGDSASEAAQRATATRKARHPHLMPVWDAEARAIRSVNLATVQMIAIDGHAHAYSN